MHTSRIWPSSRNTAIDRYVYTYLYMYMYMYMYMYTYIVTFTPLESGRLRAI